MKTEVVRITPEMAAEWLKLNVGNRPISNAIVESYTRAILSGNWSLTHQGIAFDENGVLRDGQHRMNAIIRAGIPVEMNVTFGMPWADGEIKEIDTHRVRTYNNIMQMSGQTDRIYVVTAGIVRAFMSYKVTPANRTIKMQPYQISDYIDRHYEELAFIANAFRFTGHSQKNQGFKHAAAIVAAAGLSALYGHENRDAIDKFGQVWCENDTTLCQSYNTKLCLDAKERFNRSRRTVEMFNFIENSIRGFSENKTRVKLLDCYPLDKSIAL